LHARQTIVKRRETCSTGLGGASVFSTQAELLAHISSERLVANLVFDAKESALYLTAQDHLIEVQLKTMQINNAQRVKLGSSTLYA